MEVNGGKNGIIGLKSIFYSYFHKILFFWSMQSAKSKSDLFYTTSVYLYILYADV